MRNRAVSGVKATWLGDSGITVGVVPSSLTDRCVHPTKKKEKSASTITTSNVRMASVYTSSMTDPFAEVTQELEQLQARPELKQATFAGGCFWCMEGPFEAMEGVAAAVVGFAGGTVEHPTYEKVVQGSTGHREAVQVWYDPSKVTYQQLVETYFWQIDPTDPYGQFADQGDHYRTAVFYHDDEQKQTAATYIQELNQSGRYQKPIVVEILRYTNFFPAEDYHQQFYQKQAEYYARYKKGSGRQEYIEAMQRKYAA